MENLKAIKEFLESKGVCPGSEPLTLEQLDTLMAQVTANFGEEAFSFVLDCFMPEGEPVEPGYEDSLSHQRFIPESWEEFYDM